LRFLALRPPSALEEFDPMGKKSPSQLFDERIRTFTLSATLRKDLEDGGIGADAVEAARKRIVVDPAYNQALEACGEDPGEFRLAWARAVIAAAVSSSDAAVIDTQALTGLATALAGDVGNQPKGLLGDWLNQALATVGTRLLGRHRGRLSDMVVPYIGDVLV